MRIRLNLSEWDFDSNAPIGKPGGFGAVFCGTSVEHGPIAIKQLKVSARDAAHREMRIASELAGKDFSNVIPVYDAGLDAESDQYFVVMARAERSLKEAIDASRGFDDSETLRILSEIVEGLKNVPHIVHRDLKPANVLFHDGQWKLADFGIARFVEESTSVNTLGDCLSPPFASPEQWKQESVSNATDVYALGCIGYALKTGRPPFSGPAFDDFRRQHCEESPPELTAASPKLRSLMSMMLRKNPSARPGFDRIQVILRDLLSNIDKPAGSPGANALARIAAEHASKQSQSEAVALSEKHRQQKRQELAQEAEQILKAEIGRTLLSRLYSAAPISELSQDSLRVRLGPGELKIECRGSAVPERAFARSKWDVVAAAAITVTQAQPHYVWSSSLWFTNLGKSTEYRWYEVSYFSNPLSSSRPTFQPYHLTDNLNYADEAAAPVMGLH